MQSVLMQLIAAARLHDRVASNTMEGGLQLFVYPEQDVMLVALGYLHGAPAVQARDALLRKRCSNMERFGAWLPSMFDNGNWYVVRRLADGQEQEVGLSEQELEIARELLN